MAVRCFTLRGLLRVIDSQDLDLQVAALRRPQRSAEQAFVGQHPGSDPYQREARDALVILLRRYSQGRTSEPSVRMRALGGYELCNEQCT